METILVPTDGSIAAEKALNVALDLAQAHGAKIKLLHVLLRDKEPSELLRLPEIAVEENLAAQLKYLSEGPESVRSVEELMRNPNQPARPAPDALLQKIGTRVLQRACTFANESGVAVKVLDIAEGAAAPAIAAAAEKEVADMIVMGMRGLSPSEAFTCGSVSQEVCGSVKCTCVSVH